MAQFFSGVPGVADSENLKRLLARLDKLQAALGDMHDEEARRGVAEAEMSLWRSGAQPIEPQPIASPPRPVALSDAHREKSREGDECLCRVEQDQPVLISA